MAQLGWTSHLRQQNLSPVGRQDVPDGLLFDSDATKRRANNFPVEWKRYGLGLAIIESKRWLRPLDRRSGRRGEESTPTTQMLRYLRRIDDVSTGELRWGILTNGASWRLYWSGARSVSEQFFEIDLASILGYSSDMEFPISIDERTRWLKVFLLVFRRDSFIAHSQRVETFHEKAIADAQYHREELSSNLSSIVFERVYPGLVQALSKSDADASLDEIRDAGLIVLYRLLFVLYAEDRNLLPVEDGRYDDYALRERVRNDVGRRKDQGDVFSDTAAHYWSFFNDLCRAIDFGDKSIGLPPYNGGLFDQGSSPLIARVRLPDSVMADVIDALSFEGQPFERRYINYRDLGVQQLGSIYERLLEQEVVRVDGTIRVRPNLFARKDSGSYYTPDDLVDLIVEETVGPLVDSIVDSFNDEETKLSSDTIPEDQLLGRLKRLDPAERILNLKVCDPAMGSGHFLVNLVDYLSDRVISSMADAEATMDGYLSPLAERIDQIRNTIIGNAEDRNWTIDSSQLDDRHIVRRMVLKRCIYGVDKNPMAVELTKVSLWLHTFTVGAPLSFLDHHIRCGDSLFGYWVSNAIRLTEHQSQLYIHEPLARAMRSAAPMQIIEGLSDSEIAEAHRSADIFAEISEMTAPLDAFMSLLLAFDWLKVSKPELKSTFQKWLDGVFGDQIEVAKGSLKHATGSDLNLLTEALGIANAERFLNWQVAFPGVWSDWDSNDISGGFDAIVGNPPWDRLKLQEVEWFAFRRPEIAKAQRAADRKRMIARLRSSGDSLAIDFEHASKRATTATKVARTSGDYPMLAKGDINLYSLFVERALTLVNPDGMIGLLVPSGIASDLTAATFFKSVATASRLRRLYDFENKKVFFPEVHASFKFCAFVASAKPSSEPSKCAFYLHSVNETTDPTRCFSLSAREFARVNPNTSTSPIFRSRRDAEITTSVYDRLPVLVNRSSSEEVYAAPISYSSGFHMTNDSDKFLTKSELLEEKEAWPIKGNLYKNASHEYVPLYEGKMVQAYDHRAASIVVNPQNVHRPANPNPTALEEHEDPNYMPEPQFWVSRKIATKPGVLFQVGFKHVTATTNSRTMIAALIPPFAVGNSFPLIAVGGTGHMSAKTASVLLANLNSTPLDFILRQKVHGQNLNLYLIEQLPIVPVEQYNGVRFGSKTVEEIASEAVLELTYTAYDMGTYAMEMGYVDERGELPPFEWNPVRRVQLRAKLDALFFTFMELQSGMIFAISTLHFQSQREMILYSTGAIYRVIYVSHG